MEKKLKWNRIGQSAVLKSSLIKDCIKKMYDLAADELVQDFLSIPQESSKQQLTDMDHQHDTKVYEEVYESSYKPYSDVAFNAESGSEGRDSESSSVNTGNCGTLNLLLQIHSQH